MTGDRATLGVSAPLLIVLVLLLGACGSIAEKASEEVIENAIESESGGDVDVDVDGDGISVTGTGGESITVGEGAEIPDSITLPVPDGGSVLFAIDAGSGASATVQYPGSRFEELVATYDSYFEGQETTRSESSNPASVSWLFDGGFVSVGESPDGTAVVSITTGE